MLFYTDGFKKQNIHKSGSEARQVPFFYIAKTNSNLNLIITNINTITIYLNEIDELIIFFVQISKYT